MPFVFPPADPVGLSVCGREERFPVRRVFCIGRNVVAHAREMGCDERVPPFHFTKSADAVVPCGDEPPGPRLPYPPATTELHHEVELVVALGSGGRSLDRAQAIDAIFGYAVGVDLTRRDLQRLSKERRQPWASAKDFDGSAPVGPVRPAAVHLASGRIALSVNGRVRQEGDLADLTWDVPELLGHLSRLLTLRAGDLVFTGTPAGVAPIVPGDRVEGEVEGVGRVCFVMG